MVRWETGRALEQLCPALGLRRGPAPGFTLSVVSNKCKHLSADNTGPRHVHLGAAEGTLGVGQQF